MDAHFQALAPTAFQGIHVLCNRTEPSIFKGLASHWPAVKNWRFSLLAELVPDMQVELVAGNREHCGTQFTSSTLRSYLVSLECAYDGAVPSRYLKEFDLLDAVPHLRMDLKHGDLLPHGIGLIGYRNCTCHLCDDM